jgi:NADH:ubiquinone oxidoreductase subunit 4 (subunit M)
MILLGVFQAKSAISVIAFLGVIGAGVYALRLFISAFHNRTGPRVASRELALADATAIAPIALIILALAFYPQFGLRRSEPSLRAAVAPAQAQVHALSSGTPSKVASR